MIMTETMIDQRIVDITTIAISDRMMKPTGKYCLSFTLMFTQFFNYSRYHCTETQII